MLYSIIVMLYYNILCRCLSNITYYVDVSQGYSLSKGHIEMFCIPMPLNS